MEKRLPDWQQRNRFRFAARAQLTLVEHALCPLDRAASLRPNFVHESGYCFTDKNRNRKKATARIGAIDGLSAHDEFYLWGLLSLALSQPEPRPEFLATPYFCLRRLGIVEGTSKGGREFELFRAAIKRLAGIRYQSDYFYDPIRGEHREVSFGFLNYSLPLSPDSSRAWRFAWDPIFFELCHATGGALAFDLTLYREFDVATRRLYLLLKKMLWRTEETPDLELRRLAVEVLGFSPTIDTRNLKCKVARCVETLLHARVVELTVGRAAPKQLFHKVGKGSYTLKLRRGERLNQASDRRAALPEDSTLFEPLLSIGFEPPTIQRLMQTYPPTLLEQWADITLAAKERNGGRFFKKSPQAYFIDNIRAAAEHRRTPPDWWRELRKQERLQEEEQERSRSQFLLQQPTNADADFDDYLRTEAREAFDGVTQKLVQDLESAGRSPLDAKELATRLTRTHFWNRFRQEYPESE